MFSRPHKPSTRGEEEKLLGRMSHELASRSAASPTLSAYPPSPQPTSPLSLSGPSSQYLRGNMPSTLGVTRSNGSTASVADVPAGLGAATDLRPTTINDPFTGEPKAKLVPDHPGAVGSPFPTFEGCSESVAQDRFWSHVEKIRELQSEVAKMHIAMESIGKRPEPQPPKEKEKEKEKDKPRKHRGQTSMGRAGTATANNTDRDETGPSASDTDHAGSGRDSRGAKTTDPSTITIDSGEHFAQRKEAIQNIMKKLSDLSHQVSEFHQLPTPEINFPTSPRQTQPGSPPQTPPPLSALTITSPTHPVPVHHVPRVKVGQTQRQSPLSPQGQGPPRLMIPEIRVPTGSQTEPATPSKTTKPISMISQDGTFHESPASLQAGPTP